MITKQGNALLRYGLKGLKYLGKLSPKPIAKVVKKPWMSPALKSIGKEYTNQSLWGLPLDALSMAGGASLGGVLFGNLGGVATGRMIAPLTSKITKPWLRKGVHFGGMMAGDMAASSAADNFLPLWRKKPSISSMPRYRATSASSLTEYPKSFKS